MPENITTVLNLPDAVGTLVPIGIDFSTGG